jgi:SAM-dependent methyltransferase
VLVRELRAVARLERTLLGEAGDPERGRREAELWDEVIAPRHLERYVGEYLRFVRERFGVDLPRAAVLSIGCRTGLIEDYLQRELGLSGDRLLGLEPSAAMLEIAVRRMRAEAADPRRLARAGARSSLVLAGIHSLQRPGPASLADTVEAIAGLTAPGGIFVGDLVGRGGGAQASAWWDDDSVLLEQELADGDPVRGPQLVNDYVNVTLGEESLSYRASREPVDPLASVETMLPLFLQHLHGRVHLYDAFTLEPLDLDAEPHGDRYLLVAQQGE